MHNFEKYTFFQFQQGVYKVWYQVDLTAKTFDKVFLSMSSNVNGQSEEILDVRNNFLLCHTLSPKVPSSLYIIEQNMNYIPLDMQKTLTYVSSWEVEKITPQKFEDEREGKYKNLNIVKTKVDNETPYEATICFPKSNDDKKVPLIVDIHGGPNGCSLAVFSIFYNFLCSLGFAVMTVNYRGSMGYGVGPLESLIGRCGNLDIQDCQYAVEYCLNLHKDKIDNTNIFLSGGSHGGYIGSHLITKFPTFYNACMLRNPVYNFISSFFTTDMPDWVCGCSGTCV